MEEAYWHKKARIKCYCDVDRNTIFILKISHVKQAYQKFNSLKIDNIIITNPDMISIHVVDHFTSLFISSKLVQDNVLIEYVIPSLVDEGLNKMLTLFS